MDRMSFRYCVNYKPFIVGNDRLFINNSIIFKPIDNYSRSSMIALEQLGADDSFKILESDSTMQESGSIPSETESSSSSRRYAFACLFIREY